MGREVTRVLVGRGRPVAVETADGGTSSAGRAVLAETGPGQVFREPVGQDHLPAAFLTGSRRFRYGTSVCKVGPALRCAPAWRAEGLAEAGVVHVAGGLETMARYSFEARRGELRADLLLIVGQQSVADPSRDPAGARTIRVLSRLRVGTWADVAPLLCSASAHPGGGVHGMVGRNCARRVLADPRLGRLSRLPR